MATTETDRNLLFGLLALRNNFIDQDALVGAFSTWVRDKSRKIGAVLVERGALNSTRHALLETLVEEHLRLHGGDPTKSLAALSSLGPARAPLERIADTDLTVSLVRVASARADRGPAEDDPHATWHPPVGVPSSLGTRFTIIRPHAQGGLGLVYLARDGELNRDVALKEIKEPLADVPSVRSRFQLEAEITGGLEHPGIVPVYGLGQYADGRPFYAMRFIRGESLKDEIEKFHRSKEPKLDAGARSADFRDLLGRFVDVCNAIAYAHSRGVVHRDLKPGNIMLGKYGETLVVDWGLAKATHRADPAAETAEPPLAPSSAVGSAETLPNSVFGTPGFMSPEQARGEIDRLGPASDVYSLGATLYCLLTGRGPFDGDASDSVLHRVRLGNFPRPREVHRSVPVGLEAVCLKAMAHDPADRYPSAKALARDVDRWLADAPVSARRDPPLVRLLRWGRRHSTLVAGSLTLLISATIALSIGTVIVVGKERRAHIAEMASKQAETDAKTSEASALAAKAEAEKAKGIAQQAEHRANDKAEEAQRNAVTTRRTTEFLADILTVSDPLNLGGLGLRAGPEVGRDLTAVDLLDRGAQRVANDLKDQPLVRASIQQAIGNAYRGLGRYDLARPLMESALETRRRERGANPLEVAESLHGLAWLYHDQADYDRAEPLYREALEIRRKLGDGQTPEVAQSSLHLGWLYGEIGDWKKAEPLLKQAIEIRGREPGRARDLAIARLGLAALYLEEGRLLEAALQLLGAAPTLGGGSDDYVITITSKFVRGVIAHQRGDYAGAERILRDCLDSIPKSWRSSHPYAAEVRVGLGDSLEKLGKPAEAEALYRESLAVLRRTGHFGHPRVTYPVRRLTILLRRQRRQAEGIAILDEMIAARRKIGPRNYFIADALTLKADYIMATNPAEAEPLCLEATDLFLTRPELWCSSHTISVQNLLELSQRADTIEHSERLARLAVAAGDKLWDALPFVKMAAGEWLAICHARMGRNREAEEGYRQVLAARRASSDADAKRDLHNTLWNYADLLIRQGRYAEAEPLLRESIQLRGAKPFAGTSLKSEAEILLGRCVAARGRFAEAEPLLVGGLERIRRDRRVYPPFLMDTYNSVVAFYQAWGKPDRVALWRSRRIDALFVAKPFADRGF